MNATLAEILRTKTVTDGSQTYPLHSNMSADEGELIQRAIKETRPAVTLEVGFAYGVSALFAGDTYAELGIKPRHIVLDPNQKSDWKGIGLRNVAQAGYAVELIERGSEIALPELLKSGLTVDFAIIDGWHTFDHTLVDFFFINKMLRVGGIVIIDDTHWPGIAKLVDHIRTYPCYRVYATTAIAELKSKAKIRAALAEKLNIAALRRPWDDPKPTATAFMKTAKDERGWDWHMPF